MNKKIGYTLIEVLIALAVFAIIAIITAAIMLQVFDTRERIAAEANKMNTLQLAILRIEQDTRQFVPRAVRSNDMKILSQFTGQHRYVEFTRGGMINPMSQAMESSLSRVAYTCDHDKLIRRSWLNLDTPDRHQHHDNVILDHLHSCSFDYVSNYNQILPDWRVFKLEKKQKLSAIPKAIRLTINPDNWGDMSLLFIITEGLYAPR